MRQSVGIFTQYLTSVNNIATAGFQALFELYFGLVRDILPQIHLRLTASILKLATSFVGSKVRRAKHWGCRRLALGHCGRARLSKWR